MTLSSPHSPTLPDSASARSTRTAERVHAERCCVVCACAEFSTERPYGYRSDAFRALAPDLVLMRCSRCALVQVERAGIAEASLSTYYRESYRADAAIGVVRDERDHAWFAARARALAGLTGRYLAAERSAKLRCFELGAGYGFNLDALRVVFPCAETYTDELDESATQRHAHARGRLANGPWDVVLLSHVLEHFLDPVAVMHEVHAGLRRGGVCVIEVPNETPAMLARHGFLEPHLCFFELPSLQHLLEVRLGDRFELLALGSAGPSIEQPQLSFGARAKRCALRIAARARGRIALPVLDFANDAPDAGRIFLRAVLRAVLRAR